VTQNNGITCWGSNDKGQLALGKTSASELPGGTYFFGLNSPKPVGGGAFTCVLDVGQVQCGGDNSYGQLGAGLDPQNTSVVTKPVVVIDGSGNNGPLTMIGEVAAGKQHACALKTTGEVLCWGNNLDGQLGVNASSMLQASFAVPVSWSLLRHQGRI
jgi:alpha-tubulin suppressor-like RCC1 family protein